MRPASRLDQIDVSSNDILGYLRDQDPNSVARLEGGFTAEAIKAIFKLEDVLIHPSNRFANISVIETNQAGSYVKNEADLPLSPAIRLFRDYEAELPDLTASQAICWIVRHADFLNQNR